MKDTKIKSSKPANRKGKLKIVATGSDETAIAETKKRPFPEINWDEDKKSMKISDKDGRALANSMGVEDIDTATMLMSQIVNSQHGGDDANKVSINGSINLYRSLEPKDNLECLLAAQMVATHNMAMTFSWKAMLAKQTPDGIDANINRLTKLMRTFTAQVEALRKYRTGGKQTIQVQHVNVSEGGQAVVGNVMGGGG